MSKVFSKGEVTNVREMPNAESKVLTTISKTSGLSYKSMTPAHNGRKWFVVDFNGRDGYVREDVGQLTESKHPFQDLIIQGSDAPTQDKSKDSITISFSNEIINKYIPAWNKLVAPKGIKLLALIMAQKEGFESGTRAYRYNNPGNIGNTDSGANKGFKTLEEGISYQLNFLTGIAKGTNKNFPLGKQVFLKPYYSEEIAKNQKTYKLEPYCPGYKFSYSGKLSEFIKIYSTGARQKNTYLSLIRSYFKNNGYTITDSTTLKEILELK
jgi:hypothetical protein